jgi:hypothetical protein
MVDATNPTGDQTPSPESLAQIEAKILRLKELARELNIEFKSVTLDALKRDTTALDQTLAGLEDRVDRMKRGFSEVSDTFKNVVKDITGVDTASKEITKSFRALGGIADKFKYDQEGISKLNRKDILSLQEKIKIQTSVLSSTRKELQELAKSRALTEQEKAQLIEINGILDENGKLKQEEGNYLNDLVKLSQTRLKHEEEIQKKLGLTGKLIHGITGALGKFGIDTKYFEDIEESMEHAAEHGNIWSTAMAGLKGVFKGIGSALKDPLVLMGLAVGLVTKLVHLGMEFNKEVADIGKQYGLSADAAKDLYHYAEEMAVHSGKEYMTKKNTLAAQQQLNEAFGTSAIFGEKLTEGQILLTRNLGLSGEEASKLSMYAMQYNTTQEDLVKNVGKQNKGLFSNKKVLAEVLKTEGQLAAFYKNDPALIAKAVVQAQKLGLTLEQTKNMTDKLLDFESSIAAEMEAEVLTGRDLELSRARSLALEGKTAEAAEEMLKQVGGINNFQKLNRIQQQAIAESMGMSADELANSLQKQAQLNKLSAAQKDEIKKLRAEGKGQLADQIEQGIAQGKSFEVSKMQVDTQTRFAEAMEKMKDVIASIVEGPMGQFVELLADGFKFVSDITRGIVLAVKGVGQFIGKIGDIPILGDVLKKFASIGAIIIGLKGLSGIAKYFTRGSSRSNPTFSEVTNLGAGGAGAGGGEGEGGVADMLGGSKPGSKFKMGRKLAKMGKFGRFLAGTGKFLGKIGGKAAPLLGALGYGGVADAMSGAAGGGASAGATASAPAAATTPGAKPVSANVKTAAQIKAANPGMTSAEALKQAKAAAPATQTTAAAASNVAKTGGGGFFSRIWSSIKSTASAVANPKGAIGGWLKTNIGGFLKKLVKIPIVSTLIEGVFANNDIKEMIAGDKKGPELSQAVGARVMQGLGGVLGSIGGGALGSLIPIPGVGTILGAMAGDVAGRWLGGLVADFVGAKPIGDAVLGMYGDELKAAGKTGPSKEATPLQEPKLATGGVVTTTGVAKVDQGEVFLGKDTRDTIVEMVKVLKEHTAILTAIRDKQLTVDADKLAYATSKATVTSYGNVLNSNSRIR